MPTIEDARMSSLRDKQIAEEQKRKEAVAESVKSAKVEKKKKKK